jgi:Glycogen recognition site of AMP-activated protein kinase
LKLTILREHPANDVFVTGTFDDWNKTVKLDKEGDVFSKNVDLPKAEKILYKVRYFLDGRMRE